MAWRRPPSSAQVDLAECEAILARGSKSFAAAARLLPRRIREPAAAVYAFCRVADDAVDLASAGAAAGALSELRARLDALYAGMPRADPVDRALARVVATHELPRALPEALLEGFEWDAQGRRYARLDDLRAYGVRVAGTVGLMMTWLMRRRDAITLARACDLGVAMQLTNIARDVGEDARAGRIYLPLDWLSASGIDAEGLLASPRFDPELGGVVARLLREAETLYRRADAGVARLPRDCRVAIRAARLIYAAIGSRVRRNGFDSITQRAVVSRAAKLALLARAVDGLVVKPGPDDLPWVEAGRELIEGVAR